MMTARFLSLFDANPGACGSKSEESLNL
jgi:hypothetical protein